MNTETKDTARDQAKSISGPVDGLLLSEDRLLTDEEMCSLICRRGNKWCEENGREKCFALDGAKRCVSKVLARRGSET